MSDEQSPNASGNAEGDESERPAKRKMVVFAKSATSEEIAKTLEAMYREVNG